MKEIKLADLKGKPTMLSVVPSLDTGVCAIQTKKFNESLAKLGDRVNAVTVSLDLPFAMNRFCGAEDIKNMRVGSDYQDRNFGKSWGTLINELKIESRAVFVLDKDGKVVYAQYVPEVTSEPDYDRRLPRCKNNVLAVPDERRRTLAIGGVLSLGPASVASGLSTARVLLKRVQGLHGQVFVGFAVGCFRRVGVVNHRVASHRRQMNRRPHNRVKFPQRPKESQYLPSRRSRTRRNKFSWARRS